MQAVTDSLRHCVKVLVTPLYRAQKTGQVCDSQLSASSKPPNPEIGKPLGRGNQESLVGTERRIDGAVGARHRQGAVLSQVITGIVAGAERLDPEFPQNSLR